MSEFISDLTIFVFVGCSAFALALTFYVGYVTGRDRANKTTYAALNDLITGWNKFLRRMPQDPGPKLDVKKT